MLSRSTLASALALSALCWSGAGAQIFTGMEPRQPLVIPRPAATPAPAAAPAMPEAAARASTTELVRHLPNTLEGFRITGETGELQWPVYLARNQAERSLRFRLTYLSAVSDLDETSTVTLKINGRAVSSAPIDAPQAAKSVEFPIPPGFLARGYNAVSLVFTQRHRVDCSVPATYELWTQIDRTQTGLLLDSATIDASDLTDLPALLPNADGTLPIRIVLAARTNPAQIGRFIAAVQRIAIAGHFLQPSVEFGPFADDPHGLNLVVGTREALRALAPVGTAGGTTGPFAKLVKIGASARPTLLVTGSDDGEVDAAVAQIGADATLEGTPSGLLAASIYPGLRTQGGSRLHLADFAVGAQEFSGRFLRRGFDLALPADFLAADYAHGTFDLAGGYAAGLAPGAQVRIDINGHNAGQVKLANAHGDVFRHNEMFLPLSLLRPGLNRVEVLAETPKVADATCDAVAAPARFLLLDSSELQLPTLARVQRLPDLSLLAAGGQPYIGGHPKLFVPKPDKEAMSAALSLVGSAAVAAGKVIPFEFTTAAPVDDAGATLMVAPAQALDRAVMEDIGLDPAAVEAAWRDQAQARPAKAGSERARWWTGRSDSPAACRVSHATASDIGAKIPDTADRSPTVASVPPVLAKAEGDDLFERWNTTVYGPLSWRDRITAVPGQVGTWIGRRAAALSWPGLPKAADTGIGPHASLILAQGFSAATPSHVTTIVTAPDAATLKASIACLTDPQVWSKVHGRLSVLDAANGGLVATEADRFRYTNEGGSSLGNIRLVVAGWFSLNPLAFVVLAFLTALCLSGTTLVFVRGVGRKGAK